VTAKTEYLRRYTTLAAAVDMLVQERLALLNPAKWQDTNDTYFLEMFQEHMRAKSLYAACFTQARETFHHWRVFAGDNEGVCVEFDREALLTSLLEIRGYHWNDVQYRTLPELERRKNINAFELPFLKRKGFSDEKEFRLIRWERSKPQLGVHHVPIRRQWITRIVFNPWISESLFQSMKFVLNSVEGCDSVQIIRTSLINNATWKAAVDKVNDLPLSHNQPERVI
jgi:Protein of unknown function (DUF2971)